MATSFISLNLAQKLVVGGFGGICGAVFFLNNASFYQREQVLQGPAGIYRVEGGRIVAAQLPQNARPAGRLPAFLDTIWTPNFIRENLCLNQKNLKEGRWYTLLTSGFNHSGLMHLLFNTTAFYSVATPLISCIGAPAFLGLWVVSGVTGGMISIVCDNNRLRSNNTYVGASGSIFGLLATTSVIFPQLRLGIPLLPFSFRGPTILSYFFVGSVIAYYNDWLRGIGHLGHAGGIAAGAIIGHGLKRARLIRYPIVYSAAILHALSWDGFTK